MRQKLDLIQFARLTVSPRAKKKRNEQQRQRSLNSVPYIVRKRGHCQKLVDYSNIIDVDVQCYERVIKSGATRDKLDYKITYRVDDPSKSQLSALSKGRFSGCGPYLTISMRLHL